MDESITATFDTNSPISGISGEPTPKGPSERFGVVRLTREQVEEHWHSLRDAILSALPPTENPSQELAARILRLLQEGAMQCWAMMHGGRIAAIATTRIQHEVTGGRSLLIASLYGFERVPPHVWAEGMKTLRAFARGGGCDRVLAYTADERVLGLARQLGGASEYSLLKWEV